jgi:anti-sigma B factor antagonist
MSVVRPTANLDVAGAQKLEKELVTAVPTDGELIIDLSACKFVASSGLRVLLKSAQRLSREGADLVIIGASDTVREVLKVSGFDRVVTVR